MIQRQYHAAAEEEFFLKHPGTDNSVARLVYELAYYKGWMDAQAVALNGPFATPRQVDNTLPARPVP